MGQTISAPELNVLNKSVTDIIHKTLISNETNSTNIVTLANNFKLVVGVTGRLDCENLNVNQTNNSESKIIENVSDSASTALASALTTEMKNDTSQTAKIVSQLGGNLGQNTENRAKNNIYNIIETKIQSETKIENIRRLIKQVKLENNSDVLINGVVTGQNCNFLQTNVSLYQSSLIANSIIEAVANDEVFTSITNKVKQDTSISQGGFAQLLSAILSGLIVPFLVLGGVVVVYLLYPNGKGVETTTTVPVVGSNGTVMIDTRGQQVMQKITTIGKATKSFMKIFLGFILILMVISLIVLIVRAFTKGSAKIVWVADRGINDCVAIKEIDATTTAKYNSKNECIASGGLAPNWYTCGGDASDLFKINAIPCKDTDTDNENRHCFYPNINMALQECKKSSYTCDTTTKTCSRIKNTDVHRSVGQILYTDANDNVAKTKCTTVCSV